MTTMQVEKFLFKSLAGSEPSAVKEPFEPGFSSLFKSSKSNDQSVDVAQKNLKEEVKYYTEQDLIKSRTQGYEDGYAKGYKDARGAADSVNEQISSSIKLIFEQLKKIAVDASENDRKNSNDLAEVAIKISERMAGKILQEDALDHIEKTVKNSINMLFEEEKLVLFLNGSVIEKVQSRLDDIIAEKGFAGSFEIKADNSLGVGGCKIEWKGGGIVNDKENVWKEIYKICDNFFEKA